MSSSSPLEIVHVSPSPREQNSVGLSQDGCSTHDQEQLVGAELMAMTEVECSDIQHLIQEHMQGQAGRSDGYQAKVIVKDASGSAVMPPFRSTQPIDLSASSDGHCLGTPGEKTPASHSEVPGFVLDRIGDQENLDEPPDSGGTSSPKRPRSAVRVNLDKTRFNTVSADPTRQQDLQSAALSKLLSVLQQPAEAQEPVTHVPRQMWVKNPNEVSSSCVGDVVDPITNMRGQVIAHLVEPNVHQDFIVFKSFSLNFHPERVVINADCPSSRNPAGEKLSNIGNDVATPADSRNHLSVHCSEPTEAAPAAPDSAGESQSGGVRKKRRLYMTVSQRRERHNAIERERRRRIRACCDELNTLVPFCKSHTDKVTTLQWTLSFLRHLTNTYGDTFKKEFETIFTHDRGGFPGSRFPSRQDPTQQEINDALSISFAAEQ